MLTKGILYGVGVGPGDPMLITLKADKIIGEADIIAYISNESGYSLAKSIAINSINKKSPSSYSEVSIPLIMSTKRNEINTMYDQGAIEISTHLEQGKRVVFLCEGDPLFYGSFAYLLERLGEQHAVEIIPGICSVHTAAAACKVPLGLLTENIAIFSGRHSDDEIINALNHFDNIVILKAGRVRATLVNLIKQAGRIDDACYIEYASQKQQKIICNILELNDNVGPYFSLFLINKKRDLS